MRQLKILKSITNNESPSLYKYFNEISKVSLLSVEEELDLIVKIKKGDNVAFEKFIKSNLLFVVSVAKQYQNLGLSLPDLINEGNLGLINAVNKFDETRGFKFISYAVWWIRESIMRALSQESIIRTPINYISLKHKINKKKEEYFKKHERIPSSFELSQELKIKEKDIQNYLSVSIGCISLNYPIGTDGGSIIDILINEESVIPDRALMYESLKKEINMILKELSSKEAFVLRMYFGLDCDNLTSEQIADRLGLTFTRVDQIRREAIDKIKKTENERNFK